MKEDNNNKQQVKAGEQPHKQDKEIVPLSTEGQIVIEEKQSKPNGEVNIVQYVRGNFLGKGGFAKCYEFTRVKDKVIFAGKLIAKQTLTKSRARSKLLSEIKIHRSLVHKHIVGFEHFFEDYENVYILLELCKSQSMNELLRRRKRLHELEVQCYTVQMISALKYMHAHKAIHRDLKLGNLFLNDKMEVKIGDFGLATKLEFEGDRKRTICGTPNYIAPEILEGKNGHSYEVDIWSLGVIIYTLLIGKPPYETADVKTTYQKIKKNHYSFPEHIKVSKQAKSLVQCILQLDPASRPSLDQILEHEFFRIGQAIPKHLPASTLACPPSENYIRQYWPALGRQGSTSNLVHTIGDNTGKENLKRRDGLMTERGARPGTLSPSNHDNDRRISLNTKRGLNNIEWNEYEDAYIKKWVDYSNKYGVGYILTNNSCGVYFNDNSKIALYPDNFAFDYFEKGLQRVETKDSYTLKKYPADLKKKVTLLMHFKTQMEQNSTKPEITQQNLTKSLSHQIDTVYIKKWMKTKHAILFRLSNKVVQVNFEDGTELVMSSTSKKVSYLNKNGERSNYLLSTALDSENSEMIKRLNYSRQVLEHTLKQKQPVKPMGQALTQRASSNEVRGLQQAEYNKQVQNIQQPGANNYYSQTNRMSLGKQTPDRYEEAQMIMSKGNRQSEISPRQQIPPQRIKQNIEMGDRKRPLGTAR